MRNILILLLFFFLIFVWWNLKTQMKENGITTEKYEAMKERLIISESIVERCTKNDTIDIMDIVRDVKREVDIEFRHEIK